jgi:hypothetical protein
LGPVRPSADAARAACEGEPRERLERASDLLDTHEKFYRRSFFDVVEDEEGRFEGFSHVDDWVPQRLVTATGPNPLPR